MPRIGLRVVLICVLLLVARKPLCAGEDADTRFNAKLSVQAAMETAQNHLKRGNYHDAVAVLEKQIGNIDGNRQFLRALRDAYSGHITQLRAAGKLAEAARYQERLVILQPSAVASSDTPSSPLTVPTPKEKLPLPVASLTNPPDISARGKSRMKEPSEGDPFADSNALRSGRSDLVERAAKAFASKDYNAADRYFEEAEHAVPGSAVRDQWAFAKLARVAASINGDGMATGDALEHEVADALKLCSTPGLTGFAEQLRVKMREAVASITIKHTPREGTGWAVTETANFRLFHATTKEEAEKAARLAEAARTAMARKWLAGIPANWTPRCDIYLHPTVKGYAASGGAATSPGHSSISLDPREPGRVSARRIDLRLDDTNLWIASLPHEVTHVVLAGNFGKHHLPRWADEGIAVLSEKRERIGLHLRNLPEFRRNGKLFTLETLIKLEDYPDAARVTPFYAQSVSLVEFLVSKKGTASVAPFVRDGLAGGYEAALKKHYGYASFAALEEDWLLHAFGDSVAKIAISRKK